MAEPTRSQLEGRSPLTIEADGRVQEVFLRYPLASIEWLREQLKLDSAQVLDMLADTDELETRTLAMLVCAGRRWEDPELTADDVLGWVVPQWPALRAVHDALRLAFVGALPPDPEVSGDQEDPL